MSEPSSSDVSGVGETPPPAGHYLSYSWSEVFGVGEHRDPKRGDRSHRGASTENGSES